MPIISDVQAEKEKEIARQMSLATVAAADAAKKEFQISRKSNARIFVTIATLGFIASLILYFLVSSDAGLFAAIISSTIPSVVNLIDD